MYSTSTFIRSGSFLLYEEMGHSWVEQQLLAEFSYICRYLFYLTHAHNKGYQYIVEELKILQQFLLMTIPDMKAKLRTRKNIKRVVC